MNERLRLNARLENEARTIRDLSFAINGACLTLYHLKLEAEDMGAEASACFPTLKRLHDGFHDLDFLRCMAATADVIEERTKALEAIAADIKTQEVKP